MLLLTLWMRILLSVLWLIFGNNSKAWACPQWVASMLEETLTNHTTWPGIQLTLSSPQCGLDCTISVQSTASEFAGEPALFDNTPWRLASTTKTFTAVAILKLAEQAQLDLYDIPAVHYLPNWAIDLLQQSQGVVNASRITIWQLLHHTSGLGNFASDPRWMEEVLSNPQHTWTPRSLIEWSTVNSTPVGSPGEVFHYTDTGYTLLSLILENVTRTDNFAAAIRDLTSLDQLDMPSTWWELLESQPSQGGGDSSSKERAGQYYGTIDVTHFNPTFDLYGAGGLVGNSRDLNHFGRALYEGRLLDEATMELMYVMEDSGFYGCGIVNYSLADQQAWGHGGFWNVWLYWVPSLDLVISGASNQGAGDSFDADKLVHSVISHGCVPDVQVASHGFSGFNEERTKSLNLAHPSMLMEQQFLHEHLLA